VKLRDVAAATVVVIDLADEVPCGEWQQRERADIPADRMVAV